MGAGCWGMLIKQGLSSASQGLVLQQRWMPGPRPSPRSEAALLSAPVLGEAGGVPLLPWVLSRVAPWVGAASLGSLGAGAGPQGAAGGPWAQVPITHTPAKAVGCESRGQSRAPGRGRLSPAVNSSLLPPLGVSTGWGQSWGHEGLCSVWRR